MAVKKDPKSTSTYINMGFENKSSMKKALEQKNKKEIIEFCKELIKRRAGAKELKVAPDQFYSRGCVMPSISFMIDFFDYYKYCDSLNLDTKQYELLTLDKISKYKKTRPHKIIIDSREKKPLKFNDLGIESEIDGLSFGDYAVENVNTRIERKSLIDLINTISNVGNFARFFKEMQKAEECGNSIIIVVEDDINKLLGFDRSPYIKRYVKKATPAFICNRLRTLLQKQKNVQIIFAKNRINAKKLIVDIFSRPELYLSIDIQLHFDRKMLKFQDLH